MPGITETAFFERADMLDTRLNRSKKADPAHIAKAGFQGMMRGDAEVVRGWKNRLASAIAPITPASLLAEQHRKLAEPGFAQQ
jgi:short-subunit dehydrogenase